MDIRNLKENAENYLKSDVILLCESVEVFVLLRLEVSDQEEENVFVNHNREQVLDMLQSDEEDTESPQNPESDPPIIESEEINIQVQSMRVPTGHMFPGLLDKRKLIWKKTNMKFDESKITFQGNCDLGPEILHLDSPYTCFSYFFTEDFMKSIVEETNLNATQQNPQKSAAYNISDLRKFFWSAYIYVSPAFSQY